MQPKIYPVDEHQISIDKIDSNASYVILKLRQAGHKAYLVGGGVRDLLLKQRPKDFDISTSAKPEEIRSLFRNAILIGRRFRLAHIRFGKKIIEVSTFRAGDPQSADLIVRDNEWGSEEEDVMRRDFTINGLFYDPEEQTVIDYVDGYPDLEKRVLRTIGQPHMRFVQDPVRMIRLIKFCARFNFDIDKPTFEALLGCKEEIVKSSSTRILEELLRMLESGSSKTFFHLLHEYGILRPLLPLLSRFFDQNPDNEVLALLCEVDAETRKQPLDRALLVAALLFPMLRGRLLLRAQKADRPFHLGIIQEEAARIIDETFDPFFLLPRKLRGSIISILALQWRIQPLDDKPLRNLRPPKDPSFPLALQLFKLRAAIQPDLLPFYTLWTEAMFAEYGNNPPPAMEEEPKRSRNRRRYRRPPPRMKKLLCTALEVAPNLALYHTGPALDHGPLPSIFYFALSGPDSLTLDPFNQPIQFLSDQWIRFFSMTLPAHEAGLSPLDAISTWAQDMKKGIDIIGQFIDQALEAVEFAVKNKFADPHKMGIAGLSRGAFIASHIAARDERFRSILQFAPLTRLAKAKEFHGMEHDPLVRSLDLFALAPVLSNRHVRFYIGNKDTRTDTNSCYEFAMHLVESSNSRSPKIELIISPSIGQMGHGTSPEIFRDGAQWLAQSIQ